MTRANPTDPADRARELTALVITVSTRAAQGEYPDRTGPVLVEALRGWGFTTPEPLVVPDVAAAPGPSLATALTEAVASGASVVLTTGGTGITADDLTPETTRALGGRELPGIPEALRTAGIAAGVPTAVLSRGIALAVETTLIVNLPGSPGAVRDSLRVLAEVLPHAAAELHRGLRPPKVAP